MNYDVAIFMENNIKRYSRLNFHSHTFCVWKQVFDNEWKTHDSGFKSKSGSHYFFTKEGVYRISNHWGRVANCRWRIVSNEKVKNQSEVVGFAKWTDFYHNDENALLFFIQVDFKTKEVNYFHKDALFYSGNFVLRNAVETAKAIQNIKEILWETHWAKYLNYKAIDQLRCEIIEKLITSHRTFLEIKKDYL